MFENIIDGYLERAKPHALGIGDRAMGYAERIISRLDAIHEAVESESFLERRIRLTVNGAVGVVGDTSTWSLVKQVPVGQEWELELVNLYTPAGPSQSAIAIDGIAAMSLNVETAPGNSRVGVNLPLYGGDTIYAYLSSAGSLYMQFKVRTKKPKNHGAFAGNVDQAPDRRDYLQDIENEKRHFSTVEQGTNVIGERAAALR